MQLLRDLIAALQAIAAAIKRSAERYDELDDLRDLVLKHDVELGIDANQLRHVAELLNQHGNRLTIVEVELAAHCAKQRHNGKSLASWIRSRRDGCARGI